MCTIGTLRPLITRGSTSPQWCSRGITVSSRNGTFPPRCWGKQGDLEVVADRSRRGESPGFRRGSEVAGDARSRWRRSAPDRDCCLCRPLTSGCPARPGSTRATAAGAGNQTDFEPPRRMHASTHVDLRLLPSTPVWLENLQHLTRWRWSFDLQLYPHQAAAAAVVIGRNPDILFHRQSRGNVCRSIERRRLAAMAARHARACELRERRHQNQRSRDV